MPAVGRIDGSALGRAAHCQRHTTGGAASPQADHGRGHLGSGRVAAEAGGAVDDGPLSAAAIWRRGEAMSHRMQAPAHARNGSGTPPRTSRTTTRTNKNTQRGRAATNSLNRRQRRKRRMLCVSSPSLPSFPSVQTKGMTPRQFFFEQEGTEARESRSRCHDTLCFLCALLFKSSQRAKKSRVSSSTNEMDVFLHIRVIRVIRGCLLPAPQAWIATFNRHIRTHCC